MMYRKYLVFYLLLITIPVVALILSYLYYDIPYLYAAQNLKVKAIHSNKVVDTNNPLGGNIYICDSKNNRIIEVNPQKQIVWQMTGIEDPDDVQVYAKNRLIVNQEDYSKVVEINTTTKSIVWSYGHLGSPGSQAGYLGEYVDDSFRLPNGNTG